MKLYQHFARSLGAFKNCKTSGNTEWAKKHQRNIDLWCRLLPAGGGLASGTNLNMLHSSPKRLGFDAAFCHREETGSYWTEHRVIVTADLVEGFSLTITGTDRNGIKELMHELFEEVLGKELLQAGEEAF
jgi:hypothetical protein